MPTFKVFVNERKINKKGEAPIYLRIIKNRKPTYISLGYYISQKTGMQKRQGLKSRIQILLV